MRQTSVPRHLSALAVLIATALAGCDAAATADAGGQAAAPPGAGSVATSRASTQVVPTPADETAVEHQREAIDREIASLGAHAWAADYYEGDGLGANIALSLAPDSGVAATWHGCLGLYGANRGKVVERDGMLRFEFAESNPQGFGGFPDAVRPVRWGARRYLIPESKMIDFVNAVHRGFEPRHDVHGLFLLADGDEKRPVSGLPTLPPEVLALLRRQPLEASVRSVEGVEVKREKTASLGCNHVYRLTLDRGGRDRLAPGMELTLVSPKSATTTAEVLSVTPDSATARVVGLFEDCDHPKTVPVAGWRFSTGAYDPASAASR